MFMICERGLCSEARGYRTVGKRNEGEGFEDFVVIHLFQIIVKALASLC